jgi:hypothetical protein
VPGYSALSGSGAVACPTASECVVGGVDGYGWILTMATPVTSALARAAFGSALAFG